MGLVQIGFHAYKNGKEEADLVFKLYARKQNETCVETDFIADEIDERYGIIEKKQERYNSFQRLVHNMSKAIAMRRTTSI